MLHILERFVLHVVASTFLVLVFYFLLRSWISKNAKVARFLPTDKNRLLVTCALLIAAIFPLREPFDLFMGNNGIVKTYFDIASWWSGAAISAWGLYRFHKNQ